MPKSSRRGSVIYRFLFWSLACVLCGVLAAATCDLAGIEVWGFEAQNPEPAGWLGEAGRVVAHTYMLSEQDRRAGRATVFVRFFSAEGQPLMPDPDTGPLLVFTADAAHLHAVMRITQAVLCGIPFLVYLAVVVVLRWATYRLLHRIQQGKQPIPS